MFSTACYSWSQIDPFLLLHRLAPLKCTQWIQGNLSRELPREHSPAGIELVCGCTQGYTALLMSPCSLGKDFWAVTSFLLQWNPRQRVSPADCVPQGLPSSGWHWGDRDNCGHVLSMNGTWAQLRNRNHCEMEDLSRTKELSAPEGRKALSRISPAQKLSREMHWALLIFCCHLPSAAYSLLLLSGLLWGLSCSRVKRLTNRRVHKQLINNNFAD